MPVIGLAALTAASLVWGLPAGSVPRVGDPVPEFALADARGAAHRLADWSSSRLVVVVFLGVDCPVSELYAGPLAGLAEEFGPAGAAFVGIVPGAGGEPGELARFAEAHGIGFPLLWDERGEVARRLGATRVPQALVLDEGRVLRYRGRIDDQYSVGARRTQAVGCPITAAGPRDDAGPLATAPRVTYSRDIAPILQRHCVACHSPGQSGSFALTTFRASARRAAAIAEAVEDGRMPPWHADPRYGRFANEARLSPLERAQVAAWARAGAPEGDPADLPSAAVLSAGGWRIPEPDLVVAMPEPFVVPAEGVVDYQSFVVDPGFGEDRWVRAAEIRPGNRRVVHHCNVFLQAPGADGEVHSTGNLGSYCLAATTPGTPPMVLPDGMAKRIPAGWKLVFTVHYAPIGTVQVDRTSLGLVFAAPGTVRKEVATRLIDAADLRIPPHAADYRVERSCRLEADLLLLAFFPHMHLRGKSFRYEAIDPDGRVEVLLNVPRYDFNWQNRYELAEPKRLKAGTTLRCVAHYDNSGGNPANPDPSAEVRAGEQSWDEMFNGYYDAALADQDLTRPSLWSEQLSSAARQVPAGPVLSLSLLVAAATLRLARARRAPRGSR